MFIAQIVFIRIIECRAAKRPRAPLYMEGTRVITAIYTRITRGTAARREGWEGGGEGKGGISLFPSWEFSRNKVWRAALTLRIFGIAARTQFWRFIRNAECRANSPATVSAGADHLT